MDDDLARISAELGLAAGKRHIFLCADQGKPKCCRREASLIAWNHLKERLAALGETSPRILRSKANCLRVCARGPVAVVYPDDVWYHSCCPEVLDRIIEEHLLNGRVVEEFVLPGSERG